MHGGLALTLLDSALGCAVQSTLPLGAGYTTLETKVNMVRAITSTTGHLRCEGKVIHVGRSTATAEGRLTGPDGKLYAHGTTTCLIIRL
ncbi:MAG TPA: PaaI family thioesterase [Ktedonobacterales bacterium]